MKIVIDDKIPFVNGVFEPIAEVVYAPGNDINAAMVKDADALMVRTRTQCDASLLEGSKVRIITTATIGYDHIDKDYCEQNQISWTNAPGCNAYAVVQYVYAALALLMQRQDTKLSELTLGIVGVGNVGSRVAKFAQKLGVKVLLNDPPRAEAEGEDAFVSLNQIKREADIITFHTPLTRGGKYPTFHLCNEDFLSELDQKPIIINAARGEVTDSLALLNKPECYRALVLDCWENEPDINLDLLAKADIGTFHIAGYSLEGKANAAVASVRAVSRHLGLDLDDWSVSLPERDETTEREVDLLAVVKRSYAIENDDKALRQAPEKFEYLRGAYDYRREPVCIYDIAASL